MAQTGSLSPRVVAAVAQRLTGHDFKCWFYGDSIGFEGLLEASDYLGDRKWLNFSHGFFRAWATRMRPFHDDDNTAPGHVMCEIVERTGDEILKAAVLDLAAHLRTRRKVNNVSITFEDTLCSLVQPYGGVTLAKTEQQQMKAPGPGIYLDCMHFDPPFFAHLSRIDPAGGWAEAAVKEILGYKDLLFDKTTGLYRHFWLENVDRAYTNGWGRGQGWALLGLLDVLRNVEDVEGVDMLASEALALADTMRRYQLADGNWHSLAHDERSGPEASTAAFMATAFFRGMRQGVLPVERFAEPAQRAFDAMVSSLDETGNLTGVSAAVMSALVEEHYWHVPLNRIVPWGQGPVLAAVAARKAWRGQ